MLPSNLIDGSLATSLIRDERGVDVPYPRSVWTNTAFNGTRSPTNAHCASWTSNANFATGRTGDADYINGG